jgi:hypothetical protein
MLRRLVTGGPPSNNPRAVLHAGTRTRRNWSLGRAEAMRPSTRNAGVETPTNSLSCRSHFHSSAGIFAELIEADGVDALRGMHVAAADVARGSG